MMIKQRIVFVRYWTPGPFLPESWDNPVEPVMDAAPDPYAVLWPGNAYAFTIHERSDVVDDETGERFFGVPRQVGPRYFHHQSKVEALDEARRNPQASAALLENMQSNGWQRIVWSRWGNFPQPYDAEHDVVLEARVMSEVPEAWREHILESRVIAGKLCGVEGFLFTSGLLVDLRFDEMTYRYSARYCFALRGDALEALRTWDGAGDPPGPWIKKKVSERLGPGCTTGRQDFA